MPTLPKLTDRWLRAVTTDKLQEEYWDASRPGFYVRVSKRGIKSFFLSYYSPVDHRKRSVPLGRYDPEGAESSLADAVSAWKRASGVVAQGEDPRGRSLPLTEEAPQSGLLSVVAGVSPEYRQRVVDLFGERPLVAGSFGELARDYLLHHAWVEKRRTRDDEQMLRRDLLPVWRDRPALELTRKELVNHLDAMILLRGARVAANHVRLLVSRIYNFGIGRVRVDHNPAHLIKIKGGKARARERWLSDQEIRVLWLGLEDEASLALCCQLRLEIVLMQRPGEVAAMEWQEIGDDRWWIIPGTKTIPLGQQQLEVGTKNKLSHAVFLPSLAWEILEGLRPLTGGERFVIPSPKRRDQPLWHTNGSLRRIVERLNMQPFTRHDLRRTGTTNLQRLGLAHLVDPIVNHQPRGVRASYNLWQYRDERREAMERWSDHLREVLGQSAAIASGFEPGGPGVRRPSAGFPLP